MHIEIDTGSRLDQSGATTFGFSDKIQRAIRLKQRVRDQCLQALGGEKLSKELRVFSACVYILIKDHLEEIEEVIIDNEYYGHERDIKKILLNLIWKHSDPNFSEKRIKVESIGKRRPAHEVAWKTLKGKRRADKVVQVQEILGLLIAKNK